MKSDYRVLIFTLTMLVAVPALYALGQRWGGNGLALELPAGAALASLVFMHLGDRKPPTGPPPGAKGS
jgi:hypothetical protein